MAQELTVSLDFFSKFKLAKLFDSLDTKGIPRAAQHAHHCGFGHRWLRGCHVRLKSAAKLSAGYCERTHATKQLVTSFRSDGCCGPANFNCTAIAGSPSVLSAAVGLRIQRAAVVAGQLVWSPFTYTLRPFGYAPRCFSHTHTHTHTSSSSLHKLM